MIVIYHMKLHTIVRLFLWGTWVRKWTVPEQQLVEEIFVKFRKFCTFCFINQRLWAVQRPSCAHLEALNPLFRMKKNLMSYDNIWRTYENLNAVRSWFWYLEIFGFCHLDADSDFGSLSPAAHFVVQEILYRMVSSWTSKTQNCRWQTPLESWEIDRFPSILGVENAKHQGGDRKMHWNVLRHLFVNDAMKRSFFNRSLWACLRS